MQDIHTQGSTLECLEDNEANLTELCRHRVMRAAELQSEDYHLNRALYFACRDDRERLCGTVQSGKGKVYSCLMKKKFDPKMSQEVRLFVLPVPDTSSSVHRHVLHTSFTYLILLIVNLDQF